MPAWIAADALCASTGTAAWIAEDALCASTGTAGPGPAAGHCCCPASFTTAREKASEKMILRPPDCRHTLDILCNCAMRSVERMALQCCSLQLYCMRTGSSVYDEWSMYSRQGNVAGLSALKVKMSLLRKREHTYCSRTSVIVCLDRMMTAYCRTMSPGATSAQPQSWSRPCISSCMCSSVS